LLRPPYGDYSVIDEIDGTGYFELLTALIDIGFAEEECTGIFQVLIGILHLGNVAFNEVDDIALHRKVAVIADPRPLVMAAEALGMNAMLDNLHELFTNTTKEIRGATYLSRMTRAEAENTIKTPIPTRTTAGKRIAISSLGRSIRSALAIRCRADPRL
jgi:myosin heavy subunit